jgi:phospholipase/carboxylesterase
MRTLTECGHTVHLSRGTDGYGGGDGPLVIALHGMMGSAADLFALARATDTAIGVRFALPEGPIELDAFARGRSFWPIDVGRVLRSRGRGTPTDMRRHRPAGLDAARTRLRELTDTLAGSSPVVLVGFSQGAMLACDFALREDRPLAGLALLAPTLVDEADWMPRLSRLRGLPIAMLHGASDPVLPHSIGERLRDALRDAGADVSWLTFEGGHEIPDAAAGWLGALIARALEPSMNR